MAQDMTTTQRDVARRGDSGEAMRARTTYRPLTDIYETEEGVVLTAEMPGVGADDLEITVERRVLTIRGRTPEARHEGYRKVYAEYGEGDYERVFTLSEDIDQDRIKATQKDGVLTLVLPKAEAAKAKTISVKAS